MGSSPEHSEHPSCPACAILADISFKCDKLGIRSMMDMFVLEQRLASLENKLVEAQRVKEKTVAQLSRQDRELRGLESCKVEDERHTAQLNKMVTSLAAKLDNCKTKASEAEQLAVTNLNLFRRNQQELEEAETKAKEKELEWAKCRKKD